MNPETVKEVAAFWDKESPGLREAILLAAGYDMGMFLDFGDVEFNCLNSWAQDSVVRLIGGKFQIGGESK